MVNHGQARELKRSLGFWALLVASAETNSVLRFDLETGAPLGVFVAPGAGGLVGPYGLARGARGTYLVTSSDNQVLEYDAAGAFVEPTLEQVTGPWLQSKILNAAALTTHVEQPPCGQVNL